MKKTPRFLYAKQHCFDGNLQALREIHYYFILIITQSPYYYKLSAIVGHWYACIIQTALSLSEGSITVGTSLFHNSISLHGDRYRKQKETVKGMQQHTRRISHGYKKLFYTGFPLLSWKHSWPNFPHPHYNSSAVIAMLAGYRPLAASHTNHYCWYIHYIGVWPKSDIFLT